MNLSFKNKKILVTGGSGSLGRYLIKELLKNGVKDITSISRDEGLIKDAKEFLNSSRVNFVVGDINDPKTIKNILKDINIVYHTAAMKDVVFAENYPREALKNNILGLLNLLDNSENVERFINVSSDKAIGVINCYGASKLLAEYLVKETNRFLKGDFINLRNPNFIGSRGSVLDVWKKQAKDRGKITLTDPEMTRFFITLSEAAKFIVELSQKRVLDADKIYYPIDYTKKFKLEDLAEAFVNLYPTKVKIIRSGRRKGEKVHEDYVKKIPLLTIPELRQILIENKLVP